MADTLLYQVHIENEGWSAWVQEGRLAGTVGQGLRIEAIRTQGVARYRVHVENIGWMDWVQEDEIAGTVGRGLRIEAIEIECESLNYQVHVQNVGWLDFARNGETAGTTGGGLRIEAMAFINNMVEDIKAAFANGNFNLKAAIDFVGSGAAEFFKSIGIGGSDFGSLVAPVSGGITSWFGYRDDVEGVGSSYHQGIDIGAAEGTPIGAAGAGTVTQAGWNGGYGYSVTLDHGNGLETLYGHMSEVLVAVGDVVSQLQTIGLVGSTGNSTGPHLHFSVIKDGEQVDPASIFGYASGTNYATAGLHWVGEKGPELVNFKGGESVYDAETSELLAKGNVIMEVTINSPTPLSPAKTAKLLKRSVQELLMN